MLRKANYLTSDETHIVKLVFKPGTCLIEARSPDKGEASVTVEAEYDGEEMDISFNAQYLQDCLRVLGSDDVRMEMKDSSRPGVIREGQDFLYVLMPVSQRE